MEKQALMVVGQLIRHKLFGYRGVVIDIDPHFMLTDEWYETMAKTRPPKDEPWYRVLVHDSATETYVAERNLEADDSVDPIKHSELDVHFSDFQNGRYISHQKIN
jgi:heat shock protein HspQ